MYAKFFKRVFDFVISFFGLLVLSPFFLIIWILLLIANKGQAFFIQPRPGKDEQIFHIVKFKTMNDKRDSSGNLLPDSERLTRTGLWVRKLSLDEIPQLLNVLKGEMSLIGPRPLLIRYLPLYNSEQKRRHEVRPGITGWAQVNGRNTLSWQKKFEYDVWYVDHLSFQLDMKIIWMTLIKVLKREGISSEGEATMRPFTVI